MSQQSLAMTLLLAVVVFFGGIIAYDVVAKNRLHINQPKTNWEWSDDWNNVQPPEQPKVEPKKEEPKEEPKQPEPPQGQIVASSLDDAVAKATQYNMQILIFFEADWCSWCKKMKSETLTNAQVKSAMQKFVFLEINTDQNKNIAQQFNIRSLPSYVISNTEKKAVKTGQGYKPADQFISWLGSQETVPNQPRR